MLKIIYNSVTLDMNLEYHKTSEDQKLFTLSNICSSHGREQVHTISGDVI